MNGRSAHRARAARAANRLGVALLSSIAALAAAGSAQAQHAAPIAPIAPIAGARMEGDMHAYFRGEKLAGPFFFGAGLAQAGAGAILVTRDDELARGAAYPLFGLALVQMIVGATVFLRTDAQVARLDAQLKTDPAAFKAAEAERMRKVNNQFILLMLTEAVFIAGGTAMASVAAQNDCCRTVQGVGLGLAAGSATLLTLDLFAFARGRSYEDSLRRFSPGGPGPSAPTGIWPAAPGRRF